MYFCSKYMDDIGTKFTQLERNADGVHQNYEGLSIFAPSGIHIGRGRSRKLSSKEFSEARDYVLKNCDEVQPYLQ